MIITTRKYALSKERYLNLAFGQLLRRQWWVGLLGGALVAAILFYKRGWSWWVLLPLVGLLLYAAFWGLQFYGATMLEQNQMLFAPMAYEISSQRILMKLSAKQGAPIAWKQVQRVQLHKDAFLLVLSLAQFVYLPHRIFKSTNEVQFMQLLLRRKGLVR